MVSLIITFEETTKTILHGEKKLASSCDFQSVFECVRNGYQISKSNRLEISFSELIVKLNHGIPYLP